MISISKVACVASVSARVRRENITQLETLATQAISKAKHLPSFWNRGSGELGYGRFGFRMKKNLGSMKLF